LLQIITKDEYRKYTQGLHKVEAPLEEKELEDLVTEVVSPSHLEARGVINSRWPISYLAVFNRDEGAWFVTILSFDPFLEKALQFELQRYYKITLW
jgi:hypothetical protein